MRFILRVCARKILFSTCCILLTRMPHGKNVIFFFACKWTLSHLFKRKLCFISTPLSACLKCVWNSMKKVGGKPMRTLFYLFSIFYCVNFVVSGFLSLFIIQQLLHIMFSKTDFPAGFVPLLLCFVSVCVG